MDLKLFVWLLYALAWRIQLEVSDLSEFPGFSGICKQGPPTTFWVSSENGYFGVEWWVFGRLECSWYGFRCFLGYRMYCEGARGEKEAGLVYFVLF